MVSTILIFLLSLFPSIVISQTIRVSNFRTLPLPPPAAGPESIASDRPLLPLLLGNLYTGVSDGRILKYNGLTSTFRDFAITSPNRSSALCDGTNSPILGSTCGRPLGLDFFFLRSQLFIADAFLGLFVVGENGNRAIQVATQLATSAEGIPFGSLNGLTVDQLTGDVYFTDFSSSLPSQLPIAANDTTGRLLKYDYRTRQVTVLLRSLAGPNGVALSVDRLYVLVAESLANRVRRFWLRGPRAFTSEVVVNLQGRPNNIRRISITDFSVAVTVTTTPGTLINATTNVPIVVRINGDGQVLQTVSLAQFYLNTTISEFQQIGLQYYVGSNEANFIGVVN